MPDALTDHAAATASVDKAIQWWDANPAEIRRPQGSSLHKLIEDWTAGLVVLPARETLRRQAVEAMLLGDNQVFLVQHDWAGALGHAIDFGTVNYRLPFPECAFEFDVSGHRVIYIEHEGMGSILAVRSIQRWCVFRIDPGYAPEREREQALAGILQLVAENVRAMTVVLETKGAETRRVEAPRALNKSRAKARKPAIYGYHEVDLSRHGGNHVGEGAGVGSGKRLHFRRGHWRHADGDRTWVRWTIAGNPDLGFIEKRYRL